VHVVEGVYDDDDDDDDDDVLLVTHLLIKSADSCNNANTFLEFG